MSLTNSRYYEEKYPEVESFVMVNVKQIADMGAYVKLLEYGASLPRCLEPCARSAGNFAANERGADAGGCAQTTSTA